MKDIRIFKRKTIWLLIYILTVPFLYITSCYQPAHAETNTEKSIESIESIREKSKVFVKNAFSDVNFRLKIEIGSIDHRLRLRKCHQDLHIFFPYNNKKLGNSTLGITCNDQNPWTIYIPIKTSGIQFVVTAKQTLKRGDVISESDIILQEKNISLLQTGSFTTTEVVIGKRALKNIYKGAVINNTNIGEPYIIKKGQMLFIKAEKKGISVQLKAKALMNGKKGQRIKAINLKSKRIIEGVVVNSNTIRVNM